MSIKLVCTNCKRKVKVSRWHHKAPTRCDRCGGMLTGDLTAYHRHVVAHLTRYNGGPVRAVKSFVKVAAVAFLFGVLVTAVLFTWYRNTQAPRLIAQLRSEEEAVWVEAMDGLVRMGQRSVPALVGAVAGEDQTLRDRALKALERLGDKAVEPLIGLVDRHDEVLSRSAAGLLPRVSTRQSIPRLRKLYLAEDSEAVRAVILDVFDQHPDVELLPTLVASLRPASQDEQVQVLDRRADGLCRRILEGAAEKHADVSVPAAPTQLEGWNDWLREHWEEVKRLSGS